MNFRLKTWLSAQAEREKEAEDRKQKKLERLVQKPKHEFHDESYDKERANLPDKLEDAVEHGLQAASSKSLKRPHQKSNAKGKGKKKAKLWYLFKFILI